MAAPVQIVAAQDVYLPGQTRPIPAGTAFTVPADMAAEMLANGSATLPPDEG